MPGEKEDFCRRRSPAPRRGRALRDADVAWVLQSPSSRAGRTEQPLELRAAERVAQRGGARVGDFVELTKPRVVTMVLVTTLVGFYLGTSGAPDWWLLAATLIGTGLVRRRHAGAQSVSRARRSMRAWSARAAVRCRADASQPLDALLFGAVLTAVGLLMLTLLVNPLSGLVTATTVVTYLFAYTPLKRRTPLCGVVGAVPGALPPVTGWVAATDEFGAGAWRAVRDPVSLAAAALARHRPALRRRLCARRISPAADRRPRRPQHRAADRHQLLALLAVGSDADAARRGRRCSTSSSRWCSASRFSSRRCRGRRVAAVAAAARRRHARIADLSAGAAGVHGVGQGVAVSAVRRAGATAQVAAAADGDLRGAVRGVGRHHPGAQLMAESRSAVDPSPSAGARYGATPRAARKDGGAAAGAAAQQRAHRGGDVAGRGDDVLLRPDRRLPGLPLRHAGVAAAQPAAPAAGGHVGQHVGAAGERRHDARRAACGAARRPARRCERALAVTGGARPDLPRRAGLGVGAPRSPRPDAVGGVIRRDLLHADRHARRARLGAVVWLGLVWLVGAPRAVTAEQLRGARSLRASIGCSSARSGSCCLRWCTDERGATHAPIGRAGLARLRAAALRARRGAAVRRRAGAGLRDVRDLSVERQRSARRTRSRSASCS